MPHDDKEEAAHRELLAAAKDLLEKVGAKKVTKRLIVAIEESEREIRNASLRYFM
jgi:hypothetical protein